MYQSTTAFGTLVQQDSRTFKCLLTYGETSITTVRSIKFTGGSEGEDDFSLGSTMSQYIEVTIPGKGLVVIGYSQSELIAKAIDVDMYIRLQNAIFEPLPGDIQVKLQTFVTNYPVTNISVTSDQLDGYTVFNYPISMANGWNYVKQQLNDNRDYIYDMDLQSAEAYVNSEYAVALTELEV